MNAKYTSIGIILLLLLTAGMVAGCSLLPGADQKEATPVAQAMPEEASVISEGNVAPNEFRRLSFSAAGQVVEILVEKGQQVSQGQALARLGDREQLEATLAAAEFEQQAAQQTLDELNENAVLAAASAWRALLQAKTDRIEAERAWDDIDTEDTQDDIDDANDDVVDREEDLEDAQKDFDRYADLDEDHSTRKRYEEDLEDAQNDYNEAVRERDELIIERDLAEAAVEQTRAAETQALEDYEATRDGPDPDQLALAQARLNSAQAQITAIQANLDNLELNAPFDGTIVDINIIENEQVTTGSWAFLIADYSQLYIETNDLSELEVVKILIGQTVRLVPDALPDLELSGTVEEISDSYSLQSGDILYDVRILISNPDPRLRWGMTVEVTFDSE